MTKQTEMNKIVQKLLQKKEERFNNEKQQKKHFQEYKKFLGQVQQNARELTEIMEELEAFRLK